MPEIRKTGLPINDEPAHEPEDKEVFIYSMRRLAKPGAQPVASLLLSRLPKNAHILDVGGGPGTYAEAFVKDEARVTVNGLRSAGSDRADEGTPGCRRYIRRRR
jgi:hypothetical protein